MPKEAQTIAPVEVPPGTVETASSGVVPYRLTVRQFERMIDAGVFRDRDHVELLGGLLVDNMVKKPPHNVAVSCLALALRGLLPAGWFVNEEKSIELGVWSSPEPDVAIIRGRHRDYADRNPTAADVELVAEIADSSYAKDRGAKWRRYAAAKITAYWIVNLSARRLEVYSVPTGRGRSAAYQNVAIHGPDDGVSLVIEGTDLGRIKVREILP